MEKYPGRITPRIFLCVLSAFVSASQLEYEESD